MNDLQNNIKEQLENNEIRTFKVYAKEVKLEDGKSFVSCTTKYDGVFYKFKFKKECVTGIKVKGIYDVTINLNDISVQDGKIKTNKEGQEYLETSTIWVVKTLDIHKYSDEELNQAQLEKNKSIFK